MWWQWLIFGLIMILAPAGVLNLYFLASKKQENPTEDKKKNASVRVVCMILYYWLLGFFYMVSFNHWLVWQFILGGLVLLLFFTGLANAVSSPAQKGSVITFSNLLDLAVGIGVSAYLLYIIPSKKFQNVLIPIVAAVYGGLLTLVGVAWTIKTGEKYRKEDRDQLELDRKEEERKKAIPFLSITRCNSTDCILKIKWSCLDSYEKECKKDDCYGITVKNFAIKNISNNPFIIKGVAINGLMLEFETALVLEKNGAINLEITGNRMIESEEMLNDMYLIICDIFENRYKVQCILSYKMGDVIIDKMRSSFTYTVNQVAFPLLIKDK